MTGQNAQPVHGSGKSCLQGRNIGLCRCRLTFRVGNVETGGRTSLEPLANEIGRGLLRFRGVLRQFQPLLKAARFDIVGGKIANQGQQACPQLFLGSIKTVFGRFLCSAVGAEDVDLPGGIETTVPERADAIGSTRFGAGHAGRTVKARKER